MAIQELFLCDGVEGDVDELADLGLKGELWGLLPRLLRDVGGEHRVFRVFWLCDACSGAAASVLGSAIL
jgi:hypothetical protein